MNITCLPHYCEHTIIPYGVQVNAVILGQKHSSVVYVAVGCEISYRAESFAVASLVTVGVVMRSPTVLVTAVAASRHCT